MATPSPRSSPFTEDLSVLSHTRASPESRTSRPTSRASRASSRLSHRGGLAPVKAERSDERREREKDWSWELGEAGRRERATPTPTPAVLEAPPRAVEQPVPAIPAQATATPAGAGGRSSIIVEPQAPDLPRPASRSSRGRTREKRQRSPAEGSAVAVEACGADATTGAPPLPKDDVKGGALLLPLPPGGEEAGKQRCRSRERDADAKERFRQKRAKEFAQATDLLLTGDAGQCEFIKPTSEDLCGQEDSVQELWALKTSSKCCTEVLTSPTKGTVMQRRRQANHSAELTLQTVHHAEVWYRFELEKLEKRGRQGCLMEFLGVDM